MRPRPPRSTLFPYTTLFRSYRRARSFSRHFMTIQSRSPRMRRVSGNGWERRRRALVSSVADRKSTRLNSSHQITSYAVFCLKKKKTTVQLHYYPVHSTRTNYSRASVSPLRTRSLGHFFFLNATATTEIYTLSLHDALPILSTCAVLLQAFHDDPVKIATDETSERQRLGAPSPRTRLIRGRSEEHTSELQSPDHLVCRLLLEKKKNHRPAPLLPGPLHSYELLSGFCLPSPHPLARSFFFFECDRDHRDLHSFPTRRSSDLIDVRGPSPGIS